MSQTPDRKKAYMREYMRQRRAVSPPKPSVSAAVSPLPAPDPEDVREYFKERAAVIEYDQGMSREDAEAEARRRTCERFGIDGGNLK